MDGDLAPSCQIGWHPIDAQGILALEPLLNCGDETVRDGIRSLYVLRQWEFENPANDERHWTAWQAVDSRVSEAFERSTMQLDGMNTDDAEVTFEEFRQYVYQWY